MNPQILKILQKARDSRTAPGAVVGWIKNGESHIVTHGNLRYDSDSPSVTADTLYDVASVTKSIPLSSLVHTALQDGKLQLDAMARDILPELAGKYHDLLTIENLLTYTAIWDMPSGISAYATEGADAIIQAINELPLVAKPGEKYYYTNTPAIILGMIIEKIYDKSLDEIAREKLFEPLGMSDTTFDPTNYPDDLVAPTEQSDMGNIHKIVHDEAARALRQVGIISGNAGLFSTAGDLLAYCQMILGDGKAADGRQIFSAETIERLETNYISQINESASLGWELNQPRFMGQSSNPKMFGKTGFTGCAVIIDRPRQTTMVLLTNAQYPNRQPDRSSTNQLRRSLADTIFG